MKDEGEHRTLNDGQTQSPARRMANLKWIQENAAILDKEKLGSQLCEMVVGDPNCVVRHEAAFLLGSLVGEGIISGPQALAALGRAATDSSVLVRHEVALALANFQDPEAMRLLDVLERDPVPDVAESAVLAISESSLEFHS